MTAANIHRPSSISLSHSLSAEDHLGSDVAKLTIGHAGRQHKTFHTFPRPEVGKDIRKALERQDIKAISHRPRQ